jgi:hypothetical protein
MYGYTPLPYGVRPCLRVQVQPVSVQGTVLVSPESPHLPPRATRTMYLRLFYLFSQERRSAYVSEESSSFAPICSIH